MVLPIPLIRLRCGVNSYDWGKIGTSSAAAKFAAATPSENLTIEAEKPYAEVRLDSPRIHIAWKEGDDRISQNGQKRGGDTKRLWSLD
jgi:hypothetical protein